MAHTALLHSSAICNNDMAIRKDIPMITGKFQLIIRSTSSGYAQITCYVNDERSWNVTAQALEDAVNLMCMFPTHAEVYVHNFSRLHSINDLADALKDKGYTVQSYA